jgi:xanthine dehydrogenase small subunit
MSIKRAAAILSKKFAEIHSSNGARLKALVEQKALPDYFLTIPERLKALQDKNGSPSKEVSRSRFMIAGGTDLFVQKPEALRHADVTFVSQKNLSGIQIENNHCVIGVATSVEEIKNSLILQEFLPNIRQYMKLFGSTPIRERATLGGNIVNASPIGDATIFFLALNPTIVLHDGQNRRELLLREFFRGYKQLDRKENEVLESLRFSLPTQNSFFNFEKVSRRTYLDIASVNSAISLQEEGGIIQTVHISAGGVAPIPLYLSRTVEFLTGKEIDSDTIRESAVIAQEEISPINDVRGSAAYKRLLLRQLLFAHFFKFSPQHIQHIFEE